MMSPPEILRNLFPDKLYENSVFEKDGVTLGMVRSSSGKNLAVLAPTQHPYFMQFHGETSPLQDGMVMLLCPLDVANASVLRSLVPGLKPQLLGLKSSFGMGDRLGMATPGHVRAMRKAGSGISPIFAQQSVRENSRTGRDPAKVMADATWGVFQEGCRNGFGADADHLKTIEDIDTFVSAGYTFFTIDPGEYVDNKAETDSPNEITWKLETLPWDALEISSKNYLEKYTGKRFDLGKIKVEITGEAAKRVTVKIGKALAHVVKMYRHLAGKGVPFEFEISVDETDTPTSHVEHFIIASELKRLGVKWVSLAPRFSGQFEKGIDYIGDLKNLETEMSGHAVIARDMGPYKLSLHSGSDKFSVYTILAEKTQGLFHVKTAGTSYLEALRVLADTEPHIFREVLALARDRFPQDRASYHISASLDKVPPSDELKDNQLSGLLNQTDARQVLHVTFGSILTKLGDQIKTSILAHEEAYYDDLVRHFTNHLEPLTSLIKENPKK
jgi:hypothetical protein